MPQILYLSMAFSSYSLLISSFSFTFFLCSSLSLFSLLSHYCSDFYLHLTFHLSFSLSSIFYFGFFVPFSTFSFFIISFLSSSLQTFLLSFFLLLLLNVAFPPFFCSVFCCFLSFKSFQLFRMLLWRIRRDFDEIMAFSFFFCRSLVIVTVVILLFKCFLISRVLSCNTMGTLCGGCGLVFPFR